MSFMYEVKNRVDVPCISSRINAANSPAPSLPASFILCSFGGRCTGNCTHKHSSTWHWQSGGGIWSLISCNTRSPISHITQRSPGCPCCSWKHLCGRSLPQRPAGAECWMFLLELIFSATCFSAQQLHAAQRQTSTAREWLGRNTPCNSSELSLHPQTWLFCFSLQGPASDSDSFMLQHTAVWEGSRRQSKRSGDVVNKIWRHRKSHTSLTARNQF